MWKINHDQIYKAVLSFNIPAIWSLMTSFSVPASHTYSPASFFSTLSITSWRLFPIDTACMSLVEVRSLPSLYHFTSVFESETSQLTVAFWERVAFTSFWTDSLLKKADRASDEGRKIY